MKYLIILLAGFLCSCKSTTETPAPQNLSSFQLIQSKILEKSCASSGCHASTVDASYKQHQLVLKGDKVYESLVNVLPANTEAHHAGLSLIKPKDLAKSFFYQKLIYKDSPYKFGNAMPLGADALSSKQIAFIKQWIEAGAPKEGKVADESLLQ